MRLVRLTLYCLVLLIAGLAWLFWWAAQPLALRAPSLEFTIAPGSSLRSIVHTISDAGVPAPGAALYLLARLEGRSARLQAGTYAVTTATTPDSLLDKLEKGDVVLIELVVPEGWTFHQLRAAIAADKDLRQTLSGVSDAELLKSLGASEDSPEGLFSPDTYRFARGASDMELYRRAYREQQRRLADAWAARAPDLPLASAYEALILASIVEKETGRAEDRPLVAAVFINRLRLGIALQTDPSVIYGVGARYDGSLHKRDLTTDTPYNTYTRTGLPPTPIALPGAAALAAVLNPPDSQALYFVARGDGSSQFSDNLEDHNRAVARYQKGH